MASGDPRKRSVKIELTIDESEGYNHRNLATQTMTIPLPQKGNDVAKVVARTLETMNANVEQFHGPAPFTADGVQIDSEADLPV